MFSIPKILSWRETPLPFLGMSRSAVSEQFCWIFVLQNLLFAAQFCVSQFIEAMPLLGSQHGEYPIAAIWLSSPSPCSQNGRGGSPFSSPSPNLGEGFRERVPLMRCSHSKWHRLAQLMHSSLSMVQLQKYFGLSVVCSTRCNLSAAIYRRCSLSL